MSDNEEVNNMLTNIMKGVSKKIAEKKEAFILEEGTIMLEDNEFHLETGSIRD